MALPAASSDRHLPAAQAGRTSADAGGSATQGSVRASAPGQTDAGRLWDHRPAAPKLRFPNGISARCRRGQSRAAVSLALEMRRAAERDRLPAPR